MSSAKQVAKRRERDKKLFHDAGWVDGVSSFILAVDAGVVKIPRCPPYWAQFVKEHNPSRRPIPPEVKAKRKSWRGKAWSAKKQGGGEHGEAKS